MSHLKEPIVINFLATKLANYDYVLLFSAPYRFRFNANLYGCYGWIEDAPAYRPTSDTSYLIHNETTNSSIGKFTIAAANGEFRFFSDQFLPVSVAAGDDISIMSQATNGIGRFGVSLVGER